MLRILMLMIYAELDKIMASLTTTDPKDPIYQKST